MVRDEISMQCDVERGKLVLTNRALFADLVKNLGDGSYELSLRKLRATRSIQANRYWWGVVVHLFSEHTGHTPEEIHEWAKAKFIPKRLALLNGNGDVQDEYVIGGSTRKMKVDEFYEFVEHVRTFGNEQLGLNIPPPDKLWRVRETPDELCEAS
jgi:hypothetical protein